MYVFNNFAVYFANYYHYQDNNRTTSNLCLIQLFHRIYNNNNNCLQSLF